MLETPRSFINAMEGAALAAKRKSDLAIVSAWYGEFFARQKRLEKLTDFLSRDDDPQTAKNAQAIAYFHKLKARGVPVEITRLN